MSLKKSLYILFFLVSFTIKANFILLPMDETTQKNHLKAYGITYWALDKQYKASWLLNYRGGSFLLPDDRKQVKVPRTPANTLAGADGRGRGGS